MKKIMFLIAIIFISITFSTCQKDTIWVYYDETGCSDKWGVANVPDKDKMKNVKKYLRGKQIHVLKLEITSDGIFEACKACFCKTGKRIKCKIYEEDLYKAINENFYQ